MHNCCFWDKVLTRHCLILLWFIFANLSQAPKPPNCDHLNCLYFGLFIYFCMVCISIVNHFATVLLMFPMIYSILSCSVIDNKPIQCLHGKVPVSKVGSMKRLSAKAWGILFSKVSLCLIILRIVKHFMMHSYPFPSYFCFQHLCMHTCVFFISLCIAYNFFF